MRPRGLILMYHRVAEIFVDPWGLAVTPSHFAEQLEVLKKYTQPVPLRELAGCNPWEGVRRPPVALTFDDGYGDNFRNAKPLLDRSDIPATVFVVSAAIGDQREFWWDELEGLLLHPGTLPGDLHLSINGDTRSWVLGEAAVYGDASWRRHHGWRIKRDSPPSARHELLLELWTLLRPLPVGERHGQLDEIRAWAGVAPEARPGHRPLSTEELISLVDGDLIEVGAHTVTHPLMTAHSETHQAFEVQRSKADLEDLLGRPVAGFAYPYGSYDVATVSVVRRAGFEYACAVLNRTVDQSTNRLELPRIKVEDWDGEKFQRLLSRWIDV